MNWILGTFKVSLHLARFAFKFILASYEVTIQGLRDLEMIDENIS